MVYCIKLFGWVILNRFGIRERVMRKSIFIVLCAVIFSIGSIDQLKAEESFSVKKGSVVIITVGGMQVALFNDENGDCGTFYVINPKTREIVGTSGIWDRSSLLIDNGKMSMHCVFSAVKHAKDSWLESRPLIVRN